MTASASSRMPESAPPAARPAPPLTISVVTGLGEGGTSLAAFDRALVDAGIADFNLVTLSSVIPPGAELRVGPPVEVPGTWGDRLYVVLASRTTTTPREAAWAGIGWVRDPGDGAGLFVEHAGTSRDQVVDSIDLTLREMQASRGRMFGEVEYVVHGGTCSWRPTSALVAAVYRAEGWDVA